MKTKYFVLAIAALGMAACSQVDDFSQETLPVGDGEKGYIAVNLMSSDATRAAADNPEEQVVNNATFYFFDAAGNPFNINSNGNYYTKSVEKINTTPSDPNIESMTLPVVVVEKYKGEFPASVVAVVNYTGTTSFSLAQLCDNLTDVGHTSETNFIMSNAVYMDGNGAAIYGTPLTINHFQTSRDKALDNPVTIHVERIVAKISVTTETDTFDTGVKLGESAVKAKILCWNVISNPKESYLLKTIDTSWDDTTLGLTWNDAPNYRSYWTNKSLTASNHTFAYNDIVKNFGNVEYLGEYVGAANTERTKYIVAAQLQDASGAALEIAQWYGVNYVGEQALLTAVAPTLKQKFMWFDGVDTYTNIDDSQLKCVAGASGVESYEVAFQLADGVATDNWYSFDGVSYTPIADVNTELAKIAPAKIWKSGMTYYYADVKHLGTPGSVGEFGIVRNHSYQVSIKGVSGWGTPVYDPAHQVVPTKPADKDTYIAAEINVLSWRVVSQNVTLQ